MQFERFYDPVLAQASYLVGDETSGLAAVVDPRRDVDIYLEAARSRGLRIAYVVLTRTASGFVTGHRELRDRVGAEIVCSPRTIAEFRARRPEDGESVTLGPDVRLTFLMTPGATDDGLSCVVQDRARGPSPWCVFTGDALPVDAVPRVDVASVDGRSLETQSAELYDTLQRKLLALPDSTRIYPARGFTTHGSRAAPPPPNATLGQQRATNPVLRITQRAFVPISLRAAHASPPPAYAQHALKKNREECPSLERNLEDVGPLELEQALSAVAKGALLIDARPSLDYLLAHAHGSLAVPLDACFAPWIGTLVPADRPLILIPPDGRALEAAVALSRIGLDSVWGYVRGGIGALRAARPDLVARTPVLSPLEAQRQRTALLLDVRSSAEREIRRLPASVPIPLHELAKRAPLELSREQTQVVVSERGDRAATAASVLERIGFERVSALMGGIRCWEEAGQPVEGPEAEQQRRISA
jgi:glyoxylase-like metal-dependent hydrolase (beta-lactamase superfamily II)/rhodanese-related sulfurtransferase